MVRTYAESAHIDIPFRILCPVYFLRYPNPLATHVLSVDVLSREIVARPIERSTKRSTAPSPSTSYEAESSSKTAGTSSSFLGGWRFGRSSSDASESAASPSFAEEDDVQHVLKTTRLILKRGTLPKWAPAGIVRNAESWVLEESEVDLDASGTPAKGREMRCWTRNLDHTTVMAVTERNVFHETLPQARSPTPMTTRLDAQYDIESGVSFTLLRGRIEKFGYNRVVTHVDTSRQGLLGTFARFIEDRARTGGLQAFPGLLQAGRQVVVGQQEAEAQRALTSQSPSKRARLLAALRPPFLDGDFVGPVARLRRRAQDVRVWWKGLVRGGTADKEHMRVSRAPTAPSVDKASIKASAAVDDDESELYLTPMERLRKRFLLLRDGPARLHPTYTPAPGSE